jgi:TOMM system kinase/cyclase fusion protein
MSDTATMGPRAAPHLPSGMVFADRYRIDEKLGEGGFGTVYRAQQVATGQFVAIKLIRLIGGDDASGIERRIARFEREMQLCAKLHHPNLVRLIDSGQNSDGVVYTVFEYVPGRTLADILAKEGPLAPQEARYLMLQVLDALACAHTTGIVHRDLKPHNIMVSHTGARRNALVLDFGIGTFTAGMRGTAKASLTMTGEALGTPGYAAPEQLRGLEPSPRADLFAWGIVFLECLVGKPVFAGDAMADVVYRQLGPEPIPLPRALEGHPLGALLRRSTHKDASQRDVDARRLLQELEQLDLDGLAREDFIHDGSGAAPSSAFAPTHNLGPPVRLLHGERRQITAVSCALTVTISAERTLDIEEIDEILGAGQAVCAAVARRHGGHVATALGHQVLLYFGYPRTDEHDARRAARAACAIAAEIEVLGNQLATERGTRVVVSIGVHTGLFVTRDLRASREAGHPLGATATLAARLATAARLGTVLVSADTQRILRSGFDFTDEGTFPLDALPGSTRVFRLGAERPDNDSVTPASLVHETPFAGRAHELELLLERWRRVRSGTGQSSLVTGEPGIGKSRLVRELERRIAAEPHRLVTCRCSPDAVNVALQPIIDMLGRLFELNPEQSPSERTDALEAALHRHGCKPAEMMPLLAPLLSVPLGERYAPLDVSAQRQKELVLQAILSLMFALAEQVPVALVVEDLHWADPTTLELLAMLVNEAPSASVFALFTSRPEFVPSFSTTGMLQVHIARLERAEAEAMIAALLGDRALPRAVVERIVERTDGVPLFVEEMTRSLIEAEAQGAAAEAVEIPATLRDLLMARLDRLGRAKETVQIAAALGREFSFDVLAAVSALEPAAVQEDLDRLVAAELVYRKRRMREPGYLFKHALIRDAAYESMPRRSRQKVHARIVRAIEGTFPHVANERPDLLAHHHAATGQHRQAIQYAQRAGMAALQRSASAEAVAQATAALAWLDALEDPRERAQAELDLNGIITPALMTLRGWADDEVRSRAERNQALIDELGDAPHVVPTLWALTTYHHFCGHRDQARAVATRLLSLCERMEDVDLQVTALPLMGQALWIDGSFEEARHYFERLVSLYNPERHRRHGIIYGLDPRAYAELGLAEVEWFTGFADQALARTERVVQWTRELGHTSSYAVALNYLSMMYQHRGDRARTAEMATMVLDMASRHGLEGHVGYSRMLLSWAERNLDGLLHSIALIESAGFEMGLSYYRCLAAELHIERGQGAQALALTERILERADTLGERYCVAEALRLRGACLLGLGDVDGGLACLDDALATARQQGVKMLELRITTTLCQNLHRRGRSHEARVMLAPRFGWFTEGMDTGILIEARALLHELTSAGSPPVP